MSPVDEYESAVADAITSILEGSEEQVNQAFTRLGGLNAAQVLGELFLCVEDVTEGVDIDTLITVARIPLPRNAKKIVESIHARDIKALENVTSTSDFGTVVQAVLTVIVSLRDARTRL